VIVPLVLLNVCGIKKAVALRHISAADADIDVVLSLAALTINTVF